MLNSMLADAVAVPFSIGDFVGPAEIFTAVLVVAVVAFSVVKIIRTVNKKNKD